MDCKGCIALIILASTIAGGPRDVVAVEKVADVVCGDPEVLTSLSAVQRASDRTRCFSIQAINSTGVIRFWLRPPDDGLGRYNLYLGEAGQPLALENQTPIDSASSTPYWFSALRGATISYTLVVSPLSGTPPTSVYSLDLAEGTGDPVHLREPCRPDDPECKDIPRGSGPAGVRIAPGEQARFPFMVACEGDVSLWASWTGRSHNVNLALYDSSGVRRITWLGPSDRPATVIRRIAPAGNQAALWWQAVLINQTGQPISGLVQAKMVCATASGTVTYQNGRLPSADYAGAADATIKKSWLTGTFGEKVECQADGNGEEDNGAEYATLLRWQLDSIPRGVRVTGVTIQLSVYDESQDSYDVHPVLKPWSEAQVTWQRLETNRLWAGPGATGVSERRLAPIGRLRAIKPGVATITFNRAGIALVQSWLDDPASNHGVILANILAEDGVDFYCREASKPADRPALSVSFQQP